jgi:hypothetical protein
VLAPVCGGTSYPLPSATELSYQPLQSIPESLLHAVCCESTERAGLLRAAGKVMLRQMMKVLPIYPPAKQELGFGSDSCSSPRPNLFSRQ